MCAAAALLVAGAAAAAAMGAGAGRAPTRGLVVMCQRQFDGEDSYTATALDIHHWRNEGKTPKEVREAQEEYVRCFSGGRGAHREELLRVPPHQDRSRDWDVEVHVEKNWTSNHLVVTNKRDEVVRVQIDGEGRNVSVTPAPPSWFVVPPRSARQVMAVTRYQGAEAASFVWGWRAEPKLYKQTPSTTQLSSKGVTLVVRHDVRGSVLTVYNSRVDPEPVRFMVEFRPILGSARRNLVVRDSRGKWARDSVLVTVEPGQSVRAMTVRPRKLAEPWAWAFSYKWSAGDESPLIIMGLGEQ